MSIRSITDNLRLYVERQLDTFFPTLNEVISESASIRTEEVDEALTRSKNCTSKFVSFSDSFTIHNSIHYAVFIYYLSRVLWRNENQLAANRLFLLNKALSGIDLFYEIDLPDVFFLSHTTGIVLSKALYGERCIFHHGCTVGRDAERRPRLGRDIVMYPNSSIIGECTIGDNTVVAPGVQIINMNTPGNCIVFSARPRPIIKKISEIYSKRFLYST